MTTKKEKEIRIILNKIHRAIEDIQYEKDEYFYEDEK